MEEEYGSILISRDLKDFLHGCIGLGMVSLGYEVFLVMGFVDPYSFLLNFCLTYLSAFLTILGQGLRRYYKKMSVVKEACFLQ